MMKSQPIRERNHQTLQERSGFRQEPAFLIAMYEFESRIRYSEVGEQGVLRTDALVDYLQDCSTFHMEDAGVPVESLREKGRAWLLAYWDIRIRRMPVRGERIIVGTSPHKPHGLLANRDYWIRPAESRDYCVTACGVWFVLDTALGHPVRVPEAMMTPFGECRDVLSMTDVTRRILLPDNMEEGTALQVQPQQIDSNHHVNNARYIAMAEAAIRAAHRDAAERNAGSRPSFQVSRIRAEYRQAALPGDTIVPYTGKAAEGEGFVASLRDPAGSVFCNVAFT